MGEMLSLLTTWTEKFKTKPQEYEQYSVFADKIAIYYASNVKAQLKSKPINNITRPTGDLLGLFKYVTEYRAMTEIGLISHRQKFGIYFRITHPTKQILTLHDYPTILKHIATAEHRLSILKEAFPKMHIHGPLDDLPPEKQTNIREVIRRKNIKSR